MLSAGPCWKCRAEIWLPDELYNAAKRSKAVSFFCAYGHSAIFPEGETEAEKFRRERDILAQRVAERDDKVKHQREMREAADRRAAAARGQVTKIKNRVGHGVCPCCNRTFGNLARHMAGEHPDYAIAAE